MIRRPCYFHFLNLNVVIIIIIIIIILEKSLGIIVYRKPVLPKRWH